MGTKPEDASSFKPEHGSNALNPLLPAILAAVILCSILTTVFTAARLITKRLSSTYDLYDYLLMLAWVAVVTFEFCLLAAGYAGLGRHTRHILINQEFILDKDIWALEILYLSAIWLAKASLLFHMIQIFASTKSGPLYWACQILIWSNLAFYISILFPIIFECHPIWNSLYRGHCIDWKKLLVVSSAVNVSSGLLILLLAVWTMSQLQMAHKSKAGVIAIFATGSLALASSICRFVYTRHLTSSHEVSYIIAQTMLWGLAEITTIILCTCFLTIPQSVQSFRTRYPHAKPPTTPSPLKTIRKSKIFKLGNVQSSTGISNSSSGGGPLQNEAVDMEFLKSPYRQLGDEESGVSVVRDLGSKRTVGIEIAARHGLNTKSCVARLSEVGWGG